MSIALPEAIQRQVDEAEALEKELYGQEQDSNAEPVTPVETAEVVETKEPELQTEVTPAPEIKAKPGREDDVEYWKARANTLYGMNQQQAYELQQVKGQVQELSQEVMRSRTQEQAPTQTSKDTDAETFGEDLVEAMDRRAEQMAKQLVAREVGQLQAYIQQLEGKLGVVDQHVADNVQDRFSNTLTKLVPDWESINVNQGFLNWLGEVDPVYGVPRQAALDSAAQNMDANRVASIFLEYNKLTGKQVQNQQREVVRKELERSVGPSTAPATTAPPQAGRIWTMAEFEAAQDPRNIYKMGRAAADALAADAELAYSEGRIR